MGNSNDFNLSITRSSNIFYFY